MIMATTLGFIRISAKHFLRIRANTSRACDYSLAIVQVVVPRSNDD